MPFSRFLAPGLLGPLALFVLSSKPTLGQQSPVRTTASAAVQKIASFQIPSALRRQFLALGTRLQTPGAERLQLSGTLQDSEGSNPVLVTLEVGGKAQVDRGGTRIGFDGKNTSALTSRPSDAKLIKSLVDDLPEALMEHVSRGNPIRTLGIGFVDLQGKRCDYVEVPVRSKTDTRSPSFRRYCFDTVTGLLHYVQYTEPGGISVQVDFSDWRTVSGQSLPGSIIRTENRARIFTLTFQTLAVGPTANDGLFKQ